MFSLPAIAAAGSDEVLNHPSTNRRSNRQLDVDLFAVPVELSGEGRCLPSNQIESVFTTLHSGANDLNPDVKYRVKPDFDRYSEQPRLDTAAHRSRQGTASAFCNAKVHIVRSCDGQGIGATLRLTSAQTLSTHSTS
jgi:hypothetical protein